eukprot:TRINITY_DN4105_c0_g1_i1.p1 TRINITY_DN4105_c0_g1~~TRINITY_DN4105_c0_g1_i1.p1  ORF type:complete len:161 (+),score=50.66 TRINITY_DN4105_c0_g1_i1:355-837(+)
MKNISFSTFAREQGPSFLGAIGGGTLLFGLYYLTLGGGSKFETEKSLFYKTYEGQRSNNKREGNGTSFSSNYLVVRNDDEKNGSSISIDESVHYQGSWKNNKFDGEGKIFIDGLISFEGNFVNGNKHGAGKIFDKNGKVSHEGIWQDGYLVIEEEKVEEK